MNNFARWLIGLGAAVFATTGGAAVLDQNLNGLDDIWELAYGVGSLAPNGDADGDGFTNAQESAAGTNPFDANSHPQLSLMRPSPGEVRFDWPSIPGKSYSLISRPD